MGSINLPDELLAKVEAEVEAGKCCSVDHYVEKAVTAMLK